MRAAALLLVALLLPALAAAQAQAPEDLGYAGPSVETALYFHIYDMLDVLPMNAEPMPAEAPDLARGYSQPTVAPQYGGAFNRMRFFNSMGPVEYNASLAAPRIHPEKGLAQDLLLDTSKDVMLHWYMSADFLEVQQLGFEAPVHAGVLPMLTVQAEVRLGNDVRRDLSEGEVVATGSAMVDLQSVNGEVTEIVVNLGKPALDAIPRAQSFNVGVRWFQVNQAGEEVLLPGWNLHTGAQFPNRLVLPVRNPINIFFVEPQFQGDRLAVNAALMSPLGNYDVDQRSIAIEITGPGGFRAKTFSEPVLVQHTFQHNQHNVAALNGWLWDFKADSAPPGEYAVTVRGGNLQGTATAEKTATFTIAEAGEAGTAVDSEGAEVVTQQQLEEAQAEPPKKTPGPGAALALGALALLALASRRRR